MVVPGLSSPLVAIAFGGFPWRGHRDINLPILGSSEFWFSRESGRGGIVVVVHENHHPDTDQAVGAYERRAMDPPSSPLLE